MMVFADRKVHETPCRNLKSFPKVRAQVNAT